MRHRSFLLELASKENSLPKAFPESGIFVVQAGTSDAELCRYLWVEVGRGLWNEREDWTLEQWRFYLSNEAISFWIAKKDTKELGFLELARDNLVSHCARSRSSRI